MNKYFCHNKNKHTLVIIFDFEDCEIIVFNIFGIGFLYRFKSSVEMQKNIVSIIITFNNPLKAYISSKKYLITSKHADTNFGSIFIEKLGFNGFLKIIGAQNQLPITFCSDLMRNKTWKARNSTPTGLHTRISTPWYPY